MIITINEAEIKKAVATYIENQGIHNVSDDNVTMIASRGPTGMTAEVKLVPAETQEDTLKDIVADVSKPGDPQHVMVDDTAPLFGKTADAKSA